VATPKRSPARAGVVVLAYGGARQHQPLLDSLAAAAVDPGAILVVHNPARVGEAAPPLPAGIEQVQSDRNRGYAGGMNLGIAHQMRRGFELLLLLTHDARLRPGALDAMVAALDADPACGICGPVLLYTGTEAAYSYGGLTDRNGISSHLKVPPAAGSSGLAACDWVDGGTMLLRSAVVDRVGDFDERFWGYCEEADLCARARHAGFGVGVALAARADQEPGATKRRGAWAYLMTRNGLAYAHRVAGTRGLAITGLRALESVLVNLIRTGLRRTGLRAGDVEESWAIAVGTARGSIDFIRGRWGPPPAGLPGLGDLGNA
jgi:N-acetylglucosaminyl-diphospho-decaprenol L-rhamnosyltransferase